MNEEFLNGLGLEAEAVSAIMSVYNSEVRLSEIDRQLTDAFKSAGIIDEKAARSLIDTAAICEERTDISSEITRLKEEHSCLFKTEKPKFSGPVGNTPTENKREEFKNMSYKKRLELFKQSPELYNKLV